MSKRLFLLALLFSALLLGAVVRAEDEDESTESDSNDAAEAPSTTDDESDSVSPDDENSEKSDFAVTYAIFPDHGSLQLPAGSVVPILIGFQNIGETSFTITQLDGSFRHPLDFTYHIQNFSTVELETVVGPKQVASFNYYIRPHESFEPRQIGLQINLHYKDGADGVYVDAAFNRTIDIVDAVEGFDASGTVAYVLVILAVAGVVVFFRQKNASEQPAAVEKGTAEDDEDEWLANHNAQLKSPSKAKADSSKKTE